MAGGALLVAAELQSAQTNLFIAAYIIHFAAIALLLMSTVGFLGMMCVILYICGSHADLDVRGQNTYSDVPRVSIMFRIFGLLALVGLGVGVAGGILGTHIAPNDGHIGLILRRVSAGIFAGLYVLLLLAHFGAWSYRWHLRHYRRHVSFQVLV